MNDADALCVSGGGFINDTFLSHGLLVLELAEWFLEQGKPVAFFGQGLGPTKNPELRARIAAVIPECRVFGLREALCGPQLLAELSAMGEHVVVTGDDAIELASQAGSESAYTGAPSIGINLRVAAYSGINVEASEDIVRSVASCVSRLGRRAQPVPISWHDGDSDVGPIGKLMRLDDRTREEIASPLSPEGVVRLVSRCDVVFTGSYHAGVFSLSRGIPVVALSASEYYDSKFLGLSRQFGDAGITIIRPEEASDEGCLMQVLANAIESRAEVGPRLQAAARSQIESSRALYRVFLDSLAPR